MTVRFRNLAVFICCLTMASSGAAHAQDGFWSGDAASLDMRPLEAAFERSASAVDGDELRTLLRLGVSIDHRDESGRTALWYAARAGELKLIAELLADGADPDLADNEGVTPLHLIAGQGSALATADQLVSYGADINAQDRTGATPLLAALRANADLRWAEWALTRGADPFIPAASGDRASALILSRLQAEPRPAAQPQPQSQDRGLLRSALSLGVGAYAGTEAGLLTDIVTDVALGDREADTARPGATGGPRGAGVYGRVARLLSAAEAGCGSPGASLAECPAGRPVTAATLSALEIPDRDDGVDWGFAP